MHVFLVGLRVCKSGEHGWVMVASWDNHRPTELRSEHGAGHWVRFSYLHLWIPVVVLDLFMISSCIPKIGIRLPRTTALKDPTLAPSGCLRL